MSNKNLPDSISPLFLQGALELLAYEETEFTFEAIPFTLNQWRLDDFAVDNPQYKGKFKPHELGIIVDTIDSDPWQHTIRGIPDKPHLLHRPGNIIQIHDLAFGDDEGIPILMNANLLDGCKVDAGLNPGYGRERYFEFQAALHDTVYFWMPARLPSSLLIVNDEIYFSTESKNALIQRLNAEHEASMEENLQDIIHEMGDSVHNPDQPDAP